MSSSKETTIVDNEVYNVIKATAEKLEALSVYTKYEQDGGTTTSIWKQLRQQDEQAVRTLIGQLEKFAQDGKLKAK